MRAVVSAGLNLLTSILATVASSTSAQQSPLSPGLKDNWIRRVCFVSVDASTRADLATDIMVEYEKQYL